MKISIIILSFNNYAETTGKCLAALAADPDFKTWEVIVVDNASDAHTLQQLIDAQRLYPGVRFVFNSSNVGFSAGNNIGIRQATGDVFILLNSDAFPTAGMLARLAEHLARDEHLGMVGPVTNAAGNEQCIHSQGGTAGRKDTARVCSMPPAVKPKSCRPIAWISFVSPFPGACSNGWESWIRTLAGDITRTSIIR